MSATAAAWWELERGDKNAAQPTHDNVAKIAEAVGVSIPMFWSDVPRGRRSA